MEGFNIGGIRRAFSIPTRYTIPLIVSTGEAYRYDSVIDNTKIEGGTSDDDDLSDDVGMVHMSPTGSGNSDDVGTSHGGTKRYPINQVIFTDGELQKTRLK